jgi:glycosidase
MTINEHRYYNQSGSLYPLDIRHNVMERTFFDPIPGGKVRLRVHTEPGFEEVTVVINDGTLQAFRLALWAETSRFQFWQGEIQPAAPRFHYHIALKHKNGEVAYHGPTGTTGAAEFYFQVDLTQITLHKTTRWIQGAVMYQIFPERFANGNSAINPPVVVPWGSTPESFHFQGGDLIGVRENLDYLEYLGVEVLYLNPIFSSPSNHKYDCVDYYKVDPFFGGNQTLADLVTDLHQRGMKIILDASFNHCHPNFFAFKDIIDNGPDSKYWDWFTIYEYPLKVLVRPHLIPPDHQEQIKRFERWFEQFEKTTGISIIAVDDDGPMMEPTYKAWMNVISMPTINLTNPETRQYFLDVTRFWIEEYKIDGWRMDVVPFVTPDFWVDFRQAAKGANPKAVLLSEVWGNASHWLQGDDFDGTMNYTFRWLALEYFAKAKMDTPALIDGCKTMLMMYAHDMMQVCQNLLSSHDTPRFLHEAGEEIERFRLASFFQLTMPGVPSIYYGDEIGMSGGPDPDCRQAFPWDARASWDLETHDLIHSLVNLRQEHPALRYGDWETVWVDEEAFAFRRFDDNQQILIIISRKTVIKDTVIPVRTEAPDLLLGDVEFENLGNRLKIKRQGPWSGSIIEI